MTDVFDRVRTANPVPDPDRYFESLTDEPGQTFGAMSDRRSHMTVDEIVRLEQPQPEEPPSRFGSWKAAVAAVAAVAVAVVGFSLAGGGREATGATDLEVAEQFVFALETGDVAGYEALVAPNAEAGGGPFFGQPSAQWEYASHFQAATGGTHTAECRETPDSPTVDVVCTMGEMNRFRQAAGANPNRYEWSFAIEDGAITLMNFGGDLLFDVFDQVIAYDVWVQGNYSDEYAGLMGIPQFLLDIAGSESEELLPMPLVDTTEQIARHDALTSEWLASLTGTAEPAVGLTDLQVAESFVALQASGDVAGYEALVAPDAAYPTFLGGGLYFDIPSVIFAYASNFQAATGGTHEASCEEASDTPDVDVVCALSQSNRFREAAGLGPDQYDWAFVIDDGIISELYADTNGWLIREALAEVADYDTWLQANYSDEYSDLMAPNSELVEPEAVTAMIATGILPTSGRDLATLAVGTPELRARHSELTEEWATTLP